MSRICVGSYIGLYELGGKGHSDWAVHISHLGLLVLGGGDGRWQEVLSQCTGLKSAENVSSSVMGALLTATKKRANIRHTEF